MIMIVNREEENRQFGQKRSEAWPEKLKKENIDALDIYWFVTFDNKNQDKPAECRSDVACKNTVTYTEIYPVGIKNFDAILNN